MIAASIKAIETRFPRLAKAPSKAPHLLLLLLSFYNPSAVYFPICIRGLWRQLRWGNSGGISSSAGSDVGLAPELVEALSSWPAVKAVFKVTKSLSLSSYGKRDKRDVWEVDGDQTAQVISCLPPELQAFWRCQAVIAACRSVSWDYVDFGYAMKSRGFLLVLQILTCSRFAKTNRKALIKQIEYVILELKKDGGFHQLPAQAKPELALCLVESAHYLGNAWLELIIPWVRELTDGRRDEYLNYRLAELDSLLHRAKGDLDQAVRAIDEIRLDENTPSNPKSNAALGLVALQKAANHVHTLDFNEAEKTLKSWSPLSETPSIMEQCTLFEQNIQLGKALQFQGRFDEALVALKDAKLIMDTSPSLFFGQKRSGLIRLIAETAIDAGNPTDAEDCIRIEMTLRKKEREGGISASHPLRIALAKSLFFQGRFSDAHLVTNQIKYVPHLKFEIVQLDLIRAMINHVTGDWERTFHHWTSAMRGMQKLSWSKSTHATRIILLSMCDAMRQRENQSLQVKPSEQLATLEGLTGVSEKMYWISGLYRWQKCLESTDRSSFLKASGRRVVNPTVNTQTSTINPDNGGNGNN